MGSGASTQAQPKYKWNQDHVLRGPWAFLFKEKVQCACEGSRWCTREDPARQKGPNAIPGLHSSWVGEHVLAMARPWQSALASHNLVAALQQANIGMILNLQEVGEHASCGPGNLPSSGFTYDPEAFMAAGIGYYNFAWRDMGVPSLERMMDIVQVMDYVTRVEGRKIAVHCHAGLGRTGLAIACFFVFSGMCPTPEAAIQAVRQQRPGAVQTAKQAAFVTIFGQYLQHLQCLFPPQPPAAAAAAAGAEAGSPRPLATQSAPPGVWASAADGGGAAALLPKEGLLEKKETGGAVVGVYDSGLTVTVPLLQPGAAGSGAPTSSSSAALGGGGGGADPSLTDADVGLLDAPLPWTDTFHIQPRHARRDFRPRPPRSYAEALARQGRMLHGPERRAFLKLHKFLKEAVFAVIAAAQAFNAARPPQQTHPAPASVAAVISVKPISPASAKLLGIPLPGAAAASAVPSRLAVASSAGPQLPPTFAHAMAYLLACHGPAHVDAEELEPLAAHPAYVPLVGQQVDAPSVLSALAALREQLNAGRYEALARAPVLHVLMLLGAFFANFAGGSEPASLTAECLTVIARSYQSLFESSAAQPPSSSTAAASHGSRPPTASGAARARPTSAAAAAAAAAAGGGGAATPSSVASSPSLELARQAYEVLEPLDPRDLELLLLFAALLRVVARGSGPGCEEALVAVGKWAVALLLGPLARMPEAEEAVLSFLWYLAGRDEAYAMLLLLKRQRMTGGLPRNRSGAVDVEAMLAAAAATAASLAPPPTPEAVASARPSGAVPQAPPPTPLPATATAPQAVPSPRTTATVLPFPPSPGSEVTSLHDHDVGAASPSGAGSVRDSLASLGAGPDSAAAGGPRPGAVHDASDPTLLPALQLAQLLSADIQQLYKVSFREAIAGISTVLYPPPVATGRIEVHDVWR